QRADRIAFLVEHVGDDIDVGIARRADAAALLVGRRIELAEAPAEGQQVVVTELLPTQQDHRMLVPGVLHGGEIGTAQPRKVDAQDLPPDRVGERTNRWLGRDRHDIASLVDGDDRPALARDQASSTKASQVESLSAITGAIGPAKPGSPVPLTVLRL